MDKKLPNIKHMDAVEGKAYGRHTVVKMVNPYKCHFIAHYGGGKAVKGNNLFDTGWDVLPDGITLLQYKLSTGQLITIPKFKSYLSLIEVSDGLDGSRIFHRINVKGLGDSGRVITYSIILKEDRISKYKMGDIVVTKDKRFIKSPYWKLAGV